MSIRIVVSMILSVSMISTVYASASAPENPVWKPGPTPLLEPGPAGSFCETSVKDPTIVWSDGAWHVFFTARGLGEYSIGYASSETFSGLRNAEKIRLGQLGGESESYAAAPQVFYFEPQGKWYLIFQTRDSNYQPCYSVSDKIWDVPGWSPPKPLIEKDSPRKWIDFWVICDQEQTYLFYTENHEEVKVRTTPIDSFPNGWGPARTVFATVHEAVHVYKARENAEYHLLYEVRGEDGARQFGLAKAKDLLGPWEKVTDDYATGEQLLYWNRYPRWTEEVSHGEFIRSGSDQLLEYDSNRPCLLIQGILRSDHHDDYPNLVWQLGAITLERKTLPPDFERRTFEDDYGTLSCLTRPGEGDPLVLIPGTFSDATQWNEVVSFLPSDLPIILIDMRGHGGSWPPKPESSIEDLAQDTLWLLDQMGIERAYFGGHSLGGMISKEIGRAAPDRTLGVLSVEGWTTYKTAKEAFASDMR
ncbi:MAG: alpha/beta fold hydrolase, partial [Candidatus Omnitrophica bacterium]|nr:alpha/beta fold hydrolase [Candidatus Omnitrophota bacterium]